MGLLDWVQGGVSWLLRNEQLEAYDAGSSSLYRARAGLDGMRTRELRSLLLKRLGADQEDVARMLDKNDLRNLAVSLIDEELSQRGSAVMTERVWKWTLLALGVGLILVLRLPLLALVQGFAEYLMGVRYQINSKFGLVRLSIKHRLPVVALSLVAAALLELVGPLMQISVVASWVLPSHSSLRRFLFPSLSVPVSADTIMSTVTGKKRPAPRGGGGGGGGRGEQKGKLNPVTSALSDLGSYGINVGPMITIMVVSFVKGRLENWAAAHLLDIVDDRRRRYESKLQRERDREFLSRMDAAAEAEASGGRQQSEPSWGSAAAPAPGAAGGPTTTSAAAAAMATAAAQVLRGGLSMEEILRHGKDTVLQEVGDGDGDGASGNDTKSEAGGGEGGWRSGGWDELD